MLISLNHFPPWRAIPRDVQKIIFNDAFPDRTLFLKKTSQELDKQTQFFWKYHLPLLEVEYFGKSSAQILACAHFIFSHAQECHDLIKSNQKIVVVEKTESPGKYSFEFFKPSIEKTPHTRVVHTDMPLTIIEKRG